MTTIANNSASPLAHAISGSLGSALALLLLYPLERVRTELQSNAASQDGSDHQQQEEGEGTAEERPSDSPRSHSSSNESWVSCVGDENEEGSDAQHRLLTPDLESPNDAAGDDFTISILPSNSAQAQQLQRRRQQLEAPCRRRGESLLECLMRLHDAGNLYSGVGPVVTTLATSNFVFFLAHQVMKRLLLVTQSNTRMSKNSKLTRALLASSLAGALNVLVTNPLWVANLRIMVQSKEQQQGSDPSQQQRRSLVGEVMSIAKKEGLANLWKGTNTSLLLVSNPVIQFFCYEQIKQLLLQAKRRRLRHLQPPQQLAPLEAFGLGAIAKAIATIVTYPLQLAQVLLRLQAQDGENDQERASTQGNAVVAANRRPQYKGTIDCLWRLSSSSSNPIAPLFTGMQAKLLQTCLTAAVTFWSYEQILRVVHEAMLMK